MRVVPADRSAARSCQRLSYAAPVAFVVNYRVLPSGEITSLLIAPPRLN